MIDEVTQAEGDMSYLWIISLSVIYVAEAERTLSIKRNRLLVTVWSFI